ncbi:uncharacterized protein K489DRAFT_300242, partial [Dissoconium aciculare CBS 342.82]|uniref:JmjC domain-containing protein n=1 Tax=Dissoconium aciculare CBS 342.82 TaxID=1314786 RepID=A0A6J3LPK8_9PEZI
DIKECLRFNIYGYEGAFSGAHCDVLSGTWVHPIFGIKRWYWIHPKDMTERDWKDLSRDAHDWLPRRNIVRAITLRPGQTFVMPPGHLIVHAVQTIEPSAMVGGMFWDSACVVKQVKCLEHILRCPNISNEPSPIDLGDVLDELVALIREKMPQVLPELQQEIKAVRKMRCDCRVCGESCPCSQN